MRAGAKWARYIKPGGGQKDREERERDDDGLPAVRTHTTHRVKVVHMDQFTASRPSSSRTIFSPPLRSCVVHWVRVFASGDVSDPFSSRVQIA